MSQRPFQFAFQPTLADLMRLPRRPFTQALYSLNPILRAEMAAARGEWDLPFFAEWFFPLETRSPMNPVHDHLYRLRTRQLRQPFQQRQGGLSVTLAPRGSAKTTVVSLIEAAHALLYQKEGYIALFTATQKQAERRLDNLVQAFRTNKTLRSHFPEKTDKFRRCGDNSITLPGVRMDFYSAMSEVRGISHGPWRPSWIILDDVERSDRVRQQEHRRATEVWYDEIIENLGDKYTCIDLIGTLLHTDALPAFLRKKPGATFQKFVSIAQEAEEQALWDEWRVILNDLANECRLSDALAFYERHQEAMDRGARVLWPEKDSYYDLCVKREAIGRAAFEKERQNNPYADDHCPFTGFDFRRFALRGGVIETDPLNGSSWVGSARLLEKQRLRLEDLRIYGFLDPALGGGAGDFAAVATVGVDVHGLVYVLEVWLGRCSPSEQIQKIYDLHEQWHYAGFGFEGTAFQTVLEEPMLLESRARRNAGRTWDLPYMKVQPKGAKEARIIAMEPHLRNGWLLFNEGLNEEFLAQLRDFPNSRHDDGPDALAQCLALTGHGLRAGKRVEEVQVVKIRSRAGNF